MQRYPVQVVAVVLLPDQVHALWSFPLGDCNNSLRWRWIKRESLLADQNFNEHIVDGLMRRLSTLDVVLARDVDLTEAQAPLFFNGPPCTDEFS